MSRTIYIIRHGTSAGNRHNQVTFGAEGAGLTEQGIQEAKALQSRLKDLGIDTSTTPVATSLMKRAYETAMHAGFEQINKYELLNEIHGDLPPGELDAMLERMETPPASIAAAQKLLAKPPIENIWVTHGQLIAGIAYALGIPPTVLFIPKRASITEVTLP